MGSVNDSFQSSNFLLGILCCCCSLLISVNGKTYKSAINRPIKIRTHRVVRKLVGWLFWVYGPLRQYFSLYQAASQREREKEERKDR